MKILISVLEHSAEHFTVKLLQGLAGDELLIGVSLHLVLPTLISWEWVWVGICSIHLLLISCNWGDGGHPLGAMCLEKKMYPQHQEYTMEEKSTATKGCLGFGSLHSHWKPNGHSFWGYYKVSSGQIQARRRVTRLRKQLHFRENLDASFSSPVTPTLRPSQVVETTVPSVTDLTCVYWATARVHHSLSKHCIS